MDLFRRKKKVTGTLYGDPIFAEDPVNYDQVLEYLVGLSAEDYKIICETAAIYRQADATAAKIHGRKLEPTTFITPPEPKHDADAPNFLDDEPVKKPHQIKVKD